MFYEHVFRNLNKKGIKYVVIGGIALNLHGVPRATADLDIAVAIEEKNLLKIVDVFKMMGYIPRIPVEIEEFARIENLERWREEKNMKVFTFQNPKKSYEEVDILIKSPIDFNDISSTREVITAGGIQIPIVSIDMLIKLKTLSGRKQDISDIAALSKIKKLRDADG